MRIRISHTGRGDLSVVRPDNAGKWAIQVVSWSGDSASLRYVEGDRNAAVLEAAHEALRERLNFEDELFE